jgi:hypothetical protein
MQKQLIKGVLLILTIVLAACSSNGEPTPQPGDEGYPSEVKWEEAVELLYTGDVVGVTQLHNLTVTLEMKDGSQVKTIEPEIDAIFREIEKCGRPCEGMWLATE